jgi:aminoglycoside phosphotransferase (APT) family kinase protein
MNMQTTAPEIIEHETALVADLTANEEIQFNDNGWDSRVYSTTDSSGSYFVKFPRSDKIRQRYKNELAALTLLADQDCGVLLPEVLWRGEDNAYFGYRGIDGSILSRTIDSCQQDDKVRIGVQLGKFLRTLHNLTAPDMRHVTAEKEIDQIHTWYKPADAYLRENLTAQHYSALQRLVFEVWPQQLVGLGVRSVLSHGDFHFGNIILTKTQDLGVIDFGDVGYYDESKDFIDIKDAVVKDAMLRAYGSSDELLAKVTIRTNMWQIVKLTANLGKNDADGAAASLERIRAILL